MKYFQQYCYASVFFILTILTIGCGDAGSIVTPRKIDITNNDKGVPVIFDIPIGIVGLSGTIVSGKNSTQISPQILTNLSKVTVYHYKDTAYAISMDCAIYNNSIRAFDSLRLDSVFLRTGVFLANGNEVLLPGIMNSNDTLASKLNFTNEGVTILTAIDSFIKIDTLLNSFDTSFRLYNLRIIRTIDSNGIKDDTLRSSPFNPFAPPYEQIREKVDSIKITIVTDTLKYSKVPFIIEPINTGQKILAPTLVAIEDAKKKQINARFTFTVNNEREYDTKFHGKSVRLDLDIIIPIP